MKTSLPRTLVLALMPALLLAAGCTVDPVRLNRDAAFYMNQNRYERAVEVLNRSAEAYPENAETHHMLGRCYDAQGQTARAIYEYKTAIRYAPWMDAARLGLIKAYERNGEKNMSLQATRAFVAGKTAPARNLMRAGESLMQEGMFPQALMVYHAAARVEPRNAEPFLAVANHYFAQGDSDRGIDYLVRAFKVDPVYPGLAARLGEYGLRVDIPRADLFGQFPEPDDAVYEMEQPNL